VQNDHSCSYNTYVVWSNDKGATWDGGGGIIPGSAAAAYKVPMPLGEHGATSLFPAIAADTPGHVDVAFLYAPVTMPTGPTGKADPGGCAGSTSKETPPTYPQTCTWTLYSAQSSNLTKSPAQASWLVQNVSGKVPMHVGDICNLGIACVPGLSNRNLLDFIQEVIDPTTGCAHIAYADDNRVQKLRMANQVDHCFPRHR
jgi:hypothetical protein